MRVPSRISPLCGGSVGLRFLEASLTVQTRHSASGLCSPTYYYHIIYIEYSVAGYNAIQHVARHRMRARHARATH